MFVELFSFITGSLESPLVSATLVWPSDLSKSDESVSKLLFDLSRIDGSFTFAGASTSSSLLSSSSLLTHGIILRRLGFMGLGLSFTSLSCTTLGALLFVVLVLDTGLFLFSGEPLKIYYFKY